MSMWPQHISQREVHSTAQEVATARVKWMLELSDLPNHIHVQWYKSLFRQGCAFPTGTKPNNWSVVHHEAVFNTHNALTGHRAAWEASSWLSVLSWIGWFTHQLDNTLGWKAGLGQSETWLYWVPLLRHCRLTESACSSTTFLVDVIAKRKFS